MVKGIIKGIAIGCLVGGIAAIGAGVCDLANKLSTKNRVKKAFSKVVDDIRNDGQGGPIYSEFVD